MVGRSKEVFVVSFISSFFSGELLAGDIGSYTGVLNGVADALVTSTVIDPEVKDDCFDTDTGWKELLFALFNADIALKADLSEGNPEEKAKEPDATILGLVVRGDSFSFSNSMVLFGFSPKFIFGLTLFTALVMDRGRLSSFALSA